MNRRSFMTAMAALTAAPGLLLALKRDPPLPILYGDGVGDDTEALQALLDGFPVWDAREQRVVPWVSGRSLRTSQTIYVDPRRAKGPIPDNTLRILNCNLHYDAAEGYALISIPPGP